MSKTNRLKVTDLDPDITESELKLTFENTRRGGGGPVKEVKLNRDRKSAIIVFEGCEAVDHVFRNGLTIPINGKTYKLTRLAMPKKEDKHGRKTPERSMSSASSLESFKSDKSGSQSSSSATKSSKIIEGGLHTSTEKERARNRQASTSSDSSESHDKQDVAFSEPESIQDYARRTVKATVRDVTRSKDSFCYYLDDPRFHEGKFDKQSMLLDGLRRQLFVSFYDEKDARTFCRSYHGEESNFLSVEIATEEDVSFYANIISVHSLSFGLDYGRAQDKLRTFVIERAGQRVVDITQYDEPRSVLLEFIPEKCAGKLGGIGWRISGETFQGEHLITAPVYRNNKVIISGLKRTTTEDTLVRFLSHSDSGGEQGAVVNSVEWRGLQAVVELKSEKCVRSILGKAPHWLEDKEIRIQHFHPCLTAETYDDYMTRPLPQPTTRRTPAQKQSILDAEQMSVKTVIPRPDSDNGDYTRGTMDVDSCDDDDQNDQIDVRKEQHNEIEVEDGDGNEDKKTNDEGDYIKQSAKRHFDLEDYEFYMLKDMNFLEHLERKHNVAIKGGAGACYAAGQNKEKVIDAMIDILKEIKQFKTMSLRDLDMDQVEILQNPKIQMEIKQKLSRKNVTVHFQHDRKEFSITYYPAEVKSLVKDVIIGQAEMKRLSLDDEETLAVFQSTKGKEFLASLSAGNDNQLPAVARLSLKDHSITLVSSEKRNLELQEQIKSFIEENKIYRKTVPVPAGKQEFIAKFQTSLYKQITDCLKDTGTTLQCRPEENIIELKGPLKGINATEAKLLPLYEGVATLPLSLEYFGIKEFLEREDGKELLRQIQGRHQCTVVKTHQQIQNSGYNLERLQEPLEEQAVGLGTTMNFGSVKLTVKKGDITEEKCDVIVNAVGEDMDLSSSGAVGKLLLRKGGMWFQQECTNKASEMRQNGIAETSGNFLHCERIIHVSTEKFGHYWDRGLVQVFEMADKKGMKSLAFPVFGAGKKGADLQHIKDMILTAVQRFGNSGSHTLKDLRVVIFSQELIDAFLGEGHQTGRVSRQFSQPVSEKTEVTIYSKTYQSCRAAADALQKICEDKFVTGQEEESLVQQFSQNQIDDLKQFGLENYMQLFVNTEEGTITFKGFIGQESMSALQKKLRVLMKQTMEEHRKTIHRAISTAVQWQYKDASGKWSDFEPLMNTVTEIEYSKLIGWCEVADSQGRKYHIDFERKTKCALDAFGQATGQLIEIQRKDRTKEEPLPENWEPMDGANLKLVSLTRGSYEYESVSKYFQEGGVTAPVKKIERIQNKALYQQYAVKKREIESRNPRNHRNERKLFHGTNASSVGAICENGFNRNYSGKNATVYGEGVYFAVDSSYSNGYAQADSYGNKKMFVACVLVGESFTTTRGTRVLPNKPHSQFPYDSGNDGRDKIYIIFHDTQAYPEYLITF